MNESQILLAIIGVMGAYILWLSWMYRRSENTLKSVRETSSRLIADLHSKAMVKNYLALEKGMDEQQESFEQEYLTWQEKEFDYMWTLAHVMNENFDLREEQSDLLGVIHDKNNEINVRFDLNTEQFSEDLKKAQGGL